MAKLQVGRNKCCNKSKECWHETVSTCVDGFRLEKQEWDCGCVWWKGCKIRSIPSNMARSVYGFLPKPGEGPVDVVIKRRDEG